MTVRLVLALDTLDIAVVDYGEAGVSQPCRAEYDPDEHGRGMAIVEAVAASVDVFRGGGSRYVRVTLDITPPRPQAT